MTRRKRKVDAGHNVVTGRQSRGQVTDEADRMRQMTTSLVLCAHTIRCLSIYTDIGQMVTDRGIRVLGMCIWARKAGVDCQELETRLVTHHDDGQRKP
jgi:hypothetical protein